MDLQGRIQLAQLTHKGDKVRKMPLLQIYVEGKFVKVWPDPKNDLDRFVMTQSCIDYFKYAIEDLYFFNLRTATIEQLLLYTYVGFRDVFEKAGMSEGERGFFMAEDDYINRCSFPRGAYISSKELQPGSYKTAIHEWGHMLHYCMNPEGFMYADKEVLETASLALQWASIRNPLLMSDITVEPYKSAMKQVRRLFAGQRDHATGMQVFQSVINVQTYKELKRLQPYKA